MEATTSIGLQVAYYSVVADEPIGRIQTSAPDQSVLQTCGELESWSAMWSSIMT